MLYDGEKHFPFCGKKEQRMDRRTKARIAAVGTAVLMGCLIGKYYVDVQERSCTKQLFAMDTVMRHSARLRVSMRRGRDGCRKIRCRF